MGIDDDRKSNSFESTDEFERRIFGETSGDNTKSVSFFEKLDRLGKGRDRLGSRTRDGSNSPMMDGLDESFNTLSDGMDGKLQNAATYFQYDPEEIMKDDYTFRPDMNFKPGMTYEVKVL